MDKSKSFTVYGHMPQWQELVNRCETLTQDADAAHRAELQAARKRKSVIRDVIRAHDERPDLDRFAANMQREMDSLGFSR